MAKKMRIAENRPDLFRFTMPLTALLAAMFGFVGGNMVAQPIVGVLIGAVLGAAIAFVADTNLNRRTAVRWATIGVLALAGLVFGNVGTAVSGAIIGAVLSWAAYWLATGAYGMTVPIYYTPGQTLWHNSFKFICGLIFFFLIAPLIPVMWLSFNAENFFTFTPEMLNFQAEGYSLKHYRDFLGTDEWMVPLKNSLIIAPIATIIAVTLGTLAAIGLSQSHVPGRQVIMAIMISPMIVPLIISATGMFFFYAPLGNWLEANLGLSQSFVGFVKVILAHAVLGIPFVIITVTATLVALTVH